MRAHGLVAVAVALAACGERAPAAPRDSVSDAPIAPVVAQAAPPAPPAPSASAAALPSASAPVAVAASASSPPADARPPKAKKPLPNLGRGVTHGRLAPEVIQRIIKQNFGRFRLCYENNLGNCPNLQARVSVRFVIGTDGAVSRVEDAGSDLPNSATIACIVKAFHGLSFPPPEGGVVTVTYPLMFSPGG